MTPVDAALEILRGQAPGRGVHVRQIADAATRRRLVHGEPNEAWRVMRTALAAEPRERLRAGHAPAGALSGRGSVRAGASAARRGAGTRRAGVRRGAARAARADRRRRWNGASRSCRRPAFEALARVLLQREGFGPATFVKRVEGTIYVEALRGRGSRSSRCLVGFKFGGGFGRPARDRRAARGHPRARPGRRSADAGRAAGRGRHRRVEAARRRQPPIEIADGAAMAETCIRHGVGVINTMVSVDFVDADFFADIAEG